MNTLRLSSQLSALLRIGALALACALPQSGAWAQQAQGPLATSPTTPTPYNWSMFHSGGTNPVAPTANNLPINPLASQLQGTPTGLNGTISTEIPSFLIGNYDYTNTVFGTIDTTGNIAYFGNHFGDDFQTYLSWSAPFTYLASTGETTSATPSLGDSSIEADDSQTTAYTYQVYNGGTTPVTPASGVDAGWTVQWSTTVGGTTANTWGAQITDDTASGNPADTLSGNTATYEYRRQPAVSAPIGSPYPAGRQMAIWTFTAPATFSLPASAGLYSVVFHLPDPQTATNPADGTTNTNYPEHRIGDAHYVIKVNGTVVYDTDTLDKNNNLVSRTAISQTETNDPQPLAGPFALAAGDTLTVTLDNTTTAATVAANTYVLADSVSLVPTASAGGSARQDGSPVAINATDFPEIANALVYGRDNTGADSTIPFGNLTIGTTQSASTAQYAIRQLVYFGRYEGIVLTRPDGSLADANGNLSATPVTRMVGAIYCVDGNNGDVVWRFQTPDVLSPNSTTANHIIAEPSAPVYTTPAIARLNVMVDVNGTLTPETKLCVVAADDNGLVYCLDAIGNRNGTDNSTVLATAYDQPVFNPGAPVNTGSAQDTNSTGDNHAHVGNTTAYWVYRPDPLRPISQTTLTTPPTVRSIDATSNLPVPAAFGLASPTIYVDPTEPIDPTTLLPDAPAGGITLNPNGTVYIGNSNGTLYKLDATGASVSQAVPPTATQPGSAPYSTLDKYNYVLPISQTGYQFDPNTPLPTPAVKWWFAVNKATTNDTSQTANVAITSAPSIYQQSLFSTTTGPTATVSSYSIYFSTGNEDTNVGNVFSVLDGGPINPSGTVTLVPGSTDYNTLARPNWSFPNAYTNTGDKVIHAALGSISGSPVVFANPDDTAGLGGTITPYVYFAANQGPEGYQTERPVPAEYGRIWSVNALTGTTHWAYPDTVDPNKDNTAAGSATTIGGTAITATNTIADLPVLGTFRNSSPAIGIVQFPSVIGYGTSGTTPYVHADNVRADVRAARVPMLYVGAYTGSPDSSNFFALDLDGTTDNARNIFYFNGVATPALVGLTYGPGFEASPLLVTNPGPSTGATGSPGTPGGGGNAGVVFAVGTDSTMSEFSATPLTDIGADSTGPQFTNFFQLSGFGVFGSPAIAAFSSADLGTTNTGNAGGSTLTTIYTDTDWVYGSDGNLGIARGITPGDRNGSGGGVDFGAGGPGPDALRPAAVPQQLPLHTYLFDNSTAHPALSTDMSKANAIGGAVAAFEWGQKLYIRVSNVVPPNPTGNTKYFMADPTDKSVYYTNGGSVRVQLSDIDATGKVVVGRGADIATINTNLLTSLADPDSNGFVQENPSGSGAQDNVGDMLLDAPDGTAASLGTGSMWLGATTYAIGDGSNRKNTPGSRRQIISATQTVEAHDATTGAFLQNVILQVSVDSSANSYRQRNPGGTPPFIIKRLPKEDQPTFAVLNPLAVVGGGPNIPLKNNPIALQIDAAAGPFSGIPDTANPNVSDLAAYVNGNNAYVAASGVPKSGVLSGDTGQKHLLQVTTATTDIPHGSVGNNSVPNPTVTIPASNNTDMSIPGFGDYAFNVADRSALGLNGGQISSVTILTAPAEWNDNTGSYAGPGAAVNPLPWDDTPTSYRAGTNGSVDYPNINSQRIAHTLNTVNNGTPSLSNNPATLDAATGTPTTPATRAVQPDDVQVEVSVPKYQSANLQLYEKTGATTFQRIAPSGLTTSGQTVYPMGYVARERVYIDSNHNRRYDDGEAYRTFRVITGVPVDMSVSVINPTVDLGKLPQTFGVQTDADSILGPFMPFQTTSALAAVGAGYQKYFQPLVAHNEGNINLLNIHFDQRLLRYNAAATTTGATTQSALPFGSDALSALNVLSAYDMDGVTGPTAAGTNKYILRTSLDSDLVAYNRNSGLSSTVYPNATFHKSRVSDVNSVTLTVPDVSHDNPTGTTYYLPPTASGLPVVNTATNQLASYGPPYIGLDVPLGTPVGAYAQDVRLFEGIDPASTSYPDIQGTAGIGTTNNLYKPLFPPVYGGVVSDGTTTPTSTTTDQLTTVGSAVTQPYSNPTRVRASIIETRVTDGSTYGNLAQADSAPQPSVSGGVAHGAADFLPVAFRNTFWTNGAIASGDNGLSLYWTSARSATPTVPYQLVGAHVSFTTNISKQQGFFRADTTNGTWFDSATVVAPPAGVNTAISIAPDQHVFDGTNFNSDGTAYAFVQNVVSSGTAYQNNLYCYGVDPVSGAVTGTPVPVSMDTRQPKFGARGLKFVANAVSFIDALDPKQTTAIDDNLWAFWNGGTRGRSTLFFSSAQSSNVSNYVSGGATPFTAVAQVLPTPAGLSAVSDPSAVLTHLNISGSTVPAIDVTYTGVNADGNTDVYVSHYQPYIVRKPGPANTTSNYLTDANGKNVIGLALTPGPAITEQLLPDSVHQFYLARDVAWARADTIDVQISGASILQDMTKTANADGSHPLYAGIRTSYDPASNTVVYTNIPRNVATPQNVFPVGTGAVSITAVYADLTRGRVRLRTAYYATATSAAPARFDVPLADVSLVSATFQAQARRITTDRRADTEPVAFVDDAYKSNEAPGLNRVQTARYWFIWRKSAAPGTTTAPTLYTKTQRLTLYLHTTPTAAQAVPQPVALPLTNGVPTLTLTDNTTGNAININSVDVDWTRGRIYFPQTIGGIALEGHNITANFNYISATGSGKDSTTDNVHWLDEVRANDINNQPVSSTTPTASAALANTDAVDTTEHAVPMDIATNEGSPSAFLDPMAYADVAAGAYDPFNSATAASTSVPDQPHKVWLFWNSSRSGTADVYYEALDPRFSANP